MTKDEVALGSFTGPASLCRSRSWRRILRAATSEDQPQDVLEPSRPCVHLSHWQPRCEEGLEDLRAGRAVGLLRVGEMFAVLGKDCVEALELGRKRAHWLEELN